MIALLSTTGLARGARRHPKVPLLLGKILLAHGVGVTSLLELLQFHIGAIV